MSAPSESRAIVWSVVNEEQKKFRAGHPDAGTTKDVLTLWAESMAEPGRVLNLWEIGHLMAYIESTGWRSKQMLILTWMSGMPWTEEERDATGYALIGWTMLYPSTPLPQHHKGISILKDALAHYPSKEGERLLRLLTFLTGETA